VNLESHVISRDTHEFTTEYGLTTALVCSFPSISTAYSAIMRFIYKMGSGLKEMPPESDVPSFSKHSDLG
jgi:hypothetical protein